MNKITTEQKRRIKEISLRNLDICYMADNLSREEWLKRRKIIEDDN